jgi:hypothetical protein
MSNIIERIHHGTGNHRGCGPSAQCSKTNAGKVPVRPG